MSFTICSSSPCHQSRVYPTWRPRDCLSGHWVSFGVVGFHSTCLNGSSLKPTCPPLAAPQNGSIISSSQIFGHFIDDVATYQCNPGYSLSGPALKKCTWGGNDTAYWFPSNSTPRDIEAASYLERLDHLGYSTHHCKPIPLCPLGSNAA